MGFKEDHHLFLISINQLMKYKKGTVSYEEWNVKMVSLRFFFDNTILPTGSTVIVGYGVVAKLSNYFITHLNILEVNVGNVRYLPSLKLLIKIKNQLESKI